MKLILATGISGVGEKEYLKEWEDYCLQRRKKVKIFNVGEMMLRHAHNCGIKLNRENFLNADKDLLQMARSAVFSRILSDIAGDLRDYDAVVVCVHAFMFWKERFYRK